MTDLCSFLLQTLTASGAAALLLVLKAMFRDKLSPRWQFAVWGVLAAVLVIPAGWGGRYAVLNWPVFIETLKSAVTGDFGTLTQVTAPIPLPSFALPKTAADWLYLVYVAGAAALLLHYLISYVRLRLALKRGRPAGNAQVRAAAERYGLRPCPAVEVDGLPSAFVCGVFRPVLALPAGAETDEKVILHELLHLKHHDTAWGLVICFFRCVHWCNPLLWFCANQAGNDLEALCDQRVLERLEGEERRDYGRILLSMADEKYARAPGTSSMANGGRNITRRIEAIARFKRYPAGMTLVSVCMALILAVPLAFGTKAQPAPTGAARPDRLNAVMASARTAWCTTCAGALDTYAKALLAGSLRYRAMCAPLSEQNELAALFREQQADIWPRQDNGLPDSVCTQSGYLIYNLTPVGKDAYEGILVLEVTGPAEDVQAENHNDIRLAAQRVQAERQEERWVVIPLEDFQTVQAYGWSRMPTSCDELPARIYEAQAKNFSVQVRFQTVAYVDNAVQNSDQFMSQPSFDFTPKPNAVFDWNYSEQQIWITYTGSQENKRNYTSVGISTAPIWNGEPRPVLEPYAGTGMSGGSSNGGSWGGHSLYGDWDERQFISGGSGASLNLKNAEYPFPVSYAANLYLNGKLAAELTLLPTEGGAWIDD